MPNYGSHGRLRLQGKQILTRKSAVLLHLGSVNPYTKALHSRCINDPARPRIPTTISSQGLVQPVLPSLWRRDAGGSAAHWRTFPACLVSPIAASSGRRATLKRLSVQCDLQQLFIRFGRIITRELRVRSQCLGPQAVLRVFIGFQESQVFVTRRFCGGDCLNLSTTGSSERERGTGMHIDVGFLRTSASGLRSMPGGLRSGMLPMPNCAAFTELRAFLRSRMLANDLSAAVAYPKPTCPSPATSGSETRVFADARCGSPTDKGRGYEQRQDNGCCDDHGTFHRSCPQL